jgi:hypothetical protein
VCPLTSSIGFGTQNAIFLGGIIIVACVRPGNLLQTISGIHQKISEKKRKKEAQKPKAAEQGGGRQQQLHHWPLLVDDNCSMGRFPLINEVVRNNVTALYSRLTTAQH